MSSSFYVQPTILVHWKKKTLYKHIMRAANLQSIFDAKWLEKMIFSIKKVFFFSSLSILLPFRNKLLTSFSCTAMRRKAYQLINKFPLVFFWWKSHTGSSSFPVKFLSVFSSSKDPGEKTKTNNYFFVACLK